MVDNFVEEDTVYAGATTTVPELGAEDKLTLKTLEANALKAQVQYHAAADQVRDSQAALNQFAQALYEKVGLTLDGGYVLDLAKLEFVPRPQQ